MAIMFFTSVKIQRATARGVEIFQQQIIRSFQNIVFSLKLKDSQN